MGEQAKRCAYVPTWIISGESKNDLTVRIRFPAHNEHAAKVLLHLRIDAVMRDGYAPNDIENTPDLTEWLWFLASELWQEDESERDTLERMQVRRCLVRDICDDILGCHRRLGG